MFSGGYPTTNISLNDVSGAKTDVLFSPPEDGLCVPFVFLMAERGIPGELYFGGGKELTAALGASTFDPSAPYFNSSTRFAGAAMAGQGVEAMRLVDPAAKTSTIGLFIEVTHVDVVQYKKDVSGNRIVDGNGDYIPKTQVDGVTIVKEPGVHLKWVTRKLASNESFKSLVKKTATVLGKTVETYPITAVEVASPGSYGDRQGFKLYSASQDNPSVVRALNSALYRFVPMELPNFVSTTARPIVDVNGTNFNDISFKGTAVYTPTNTNYAFDYVLGNNYVVRKTGDNTLPYKMHTYGKNVGLIAADILSKSPELGNIDPYLIDLVSGADAEGLLYDHVEIDDASNNVVNSGFINYASGGDDGDTSWAKFEELVADWLAGSDHGEFGNVQQHPITHYYDPGFSMSTKYLLFNMLTLRDNLKIDVSTQDISLPANTKAEDIANGQALLFRAQLYPESVINGVGCMRVSIYAHAAELNANSPYGGLVPFTLNRLIQRRNLDGGLFIKGSSGGLPFSEVTIFRKPNWVADDKPSQAITWENCINVVRHATRTVIHYAALRTAYPNDTSLLSDDEVVDRIIYMYKIARAIYSKYAGVRQPPKSVYPKIQRDIDNECAQVFSNDNIKVKSTISQTAFDKNLGYKVSAKLAVTGSLGLRVMDINVEVGREESEA